MDRREFLQQNLRLLALGLVPAGALVACTRESTRPFSGALVAPSHVLTADGKSTIFSFYDLDRDELRELSVPLETGHIAVTHPRRGQLVFVPESAGDRACVIDVVQMKVVRELRASPGRWFGGHAEFTADGSRLYVSEFEPPPSGKGFLTVLDGTDFSTLRSHPSGGRYPHDVAVSLDGTKVTIANLGAETGPAVKHSGIYVSRFSLPDEKLLDRVELNDDPTSMNSVAKEPGGSSLSRNDDIIKGDAHYFISYMGVARPQFQIFVYPHSHKAIVDIWSIPELRLIKEFPFPEQPVALTLMRSRNFLAVATESGRLYFIDVKKRELDSSIVATKRIKVTTHINPWTGDFAG